MSGEFAVPLMGVMGAVLLGCLEDDAALPAFMFLGCLSLLMALLIAAGSVTLPANLLTALAFAAAGCALFGHVRQRRRA